MLVQQILINNNDSIPKIAGVDSSLAGKAQAHSQIRIHDTSNVIWVLFVRILKSHER